MTLDRFEVCAAICADLADILDGQQGHGSILPTSRMIEDLDLDSIDFVTLLVRCEGTWGVTLIDRVTDWTQVRTVDALAGVVLAAAS